MESWLWNFATLEKSVREAFVAGFQRVNRSQALR
jgi:hypothetical protein